MIRKMLHDWLHAAYTLPVVEDITQTKIESAIGYNLQIAPINVRVAADEKITFEVTFDIQYRCPNGVAGIGFLTLGLNDKDKQIPGFKIVSVDGVEIVEYMTKTEMIISKPVTAHINIEYNQTREIIKCIKFEEGLNCNDSCQGVTP